jgi:hypothetical protein
MRQERSRSNRLLLRYFTAEPMTFKVTIAGLVLLAPFAVLTFSREAPRETTTSPEARQEKLLENLNIESVKETLAPDFLLKDLDGNSVRLRDFRGWFC